MEVSDSLADPFGPDRRRLRIAIPGGSGQIGQILARHFHSQGHAVTVLSRRAATSPWRTVVWNGRDPGNWVQEIDGVDVVINLAGRDRKSTRLNSSHQIISYAVFCLKK